jgi:uncharacterized membrane protein
MRATSDISSDQKSKEKSRKVRHSNLDENKSRHSITIGKTPQEVFSFWRDFSNLASFMKDISEVRVNSSKKSHWIVKLKSGFSTEWDAEITSEIEGQMISWASLKGSDVETKGIVWFEEAPANLGTVVRLSMDYHVPGGKLTEFITFFMGESPDILVITNLKRLKAFLETGEIPTTEGQPSGREEEPEKRITH